MMHNQRNSSQLQGAAQPLFPVNPAAAQGIRASSNPEYGQPQPQAGLVRHLPGPPSQLPVTQYHLPLPRLTPSTDILEHVHPGSTSRGDFHSDPTSHNAMDTYNSGPPNDYVALPSRGIPGPFSYQQPPPPTQPVPLSNRVGNFNGNLPRGKKNPKKKSSDDARMVSNTGNDQRQVSHGESPTGLLATQKIQMPLHPRSPDAIPLVEQSHPSSGAVQYSGNYHHPNLPPGYHPGNGQEPFHHPHYHGQAPIQPAMGGLSRVVTKPYSPLVHECQRPTQDLRPAGLTVPTPTYTRYQRPIANGRSFEENTDFVSAQVRPHTSQPMDPHALGHQLQHRQMDSQDRQDPNSESQRAALAPVSNAGQPQFPRPSGRSRADETPRRPVQEGCTIWIGRLPTEFDKAAVMLLLRPCRGLLDVSEPRVAKSYNNNINRSYIFAEYVLPISNITGITNLSNYSFQQPADAAEALERLPQTRFASLPEGNCLMTNYPRPRMHPSPGHYQHGKDADSKQPASNVSPTKSRKGEDSSRTGKSKIEHGRKASKGSNRGKKQSPSNTEGKTGRPFERAGAVDAGQKDSGAQPQEAAVQANTYDKAALTAHWSRSGTDGQDPKPRSQDSGTIQPDVGSETHVDSVLGISGDGAKDTPSAPSDKPHLHKSYQTTSSRLTESCTKRPKKKSKGSNKMSMPENKGTEPLTVQPAADNVKPKFRAKHSIDDAGELVEESGHVKDKGNQDGFKVETSRTTAPAMPLEATPTLPKDIGTTKHSFLVRDTTGEDGDQPEASVANVVKSSVANDGIAEVTTPTPVDSARSAVPLKKMKEPKSQATRRFASISKQGSAQTAPSILSSSAPPSTSQTERSNSITQETLLPPIQAACPPPEAALLPRLSEPCQIREKLEASRVNAVIPKRVLEKDGQSQESRPDAETSVRNGEPENTAMKQNIEPPTSLALSQTGKGAKSSREDSQNSTDGKLGQSHAGLDKENAEQSPSSSLIQPPPSDSDGTSLRSPARKRAPSIPPRSSSLAAPSTPIKTHQKKKSRNLTPLKDTPPSKTTGFIVGGTHMNPSLQITGGAILDVPDLSIDPAARTPTADNSKDLPKPETPFLMDDGVRVAPPKISRESEEASNADQYYTQKLDYRLSHMGTTMQINAKLDKFDSSDSVAAPSAETRTRDHASAKKHNDLETTLREAGYRGLSDTSPFTIKDPGLAFFETMSEGEYPLKNRTNKDGRVLSWVDDERRIAPDMSFDAWKKQNEMVEVVKKATAVKRLLAGPPPLPWARIESLRQQLLQFMIPFSSDAQDQQTTKTDFKKLWKVNTLLDAIPKRESSISEMQRWSSDASFFLEENASEPSPAHAQSRKPTANSPSKSSRSTSSRRQQQEPDPQILASDLGGDEDAFRTTNVEFKGSLESSPSTLGRRTPSKERQMPSTKTEAESSPCTLCRRTPSEERPTPSVAPIPPAALGQNCRLEDLVDEMGTDRRRWSDDRHQLSTPEEEERMTISDPELKPLGGEFDMRRVTVVKDVEPEQEVQEIENDVQRRPREDKQSEVKGEELGSEFEEQDQRPTTRSHDSKNAASLASKEEDPQNPEPSPDQNQTPQLLGASFSSFGSNQTTTNEGSSEETQLNRPRGGHSPLKRSGYNAVAGRGTDGKQGVKEGASKDPWALPQGEKPWGGGRGRGGKTKRERK